MVVICTFNVNFL